jgi:hypothetical protein
MQKTIHLKLAFILLIVAFLTSGCLFTKDKTSVDNEATADVITNQEQVENSNTNPTEQVESRVFFNITFKNGAFMPPHITVNQGDIVEFAVSSDIGGVFSLPGYGVTAALNDKEATRVEFSADNIGAFTFNLKEKPEIKGTIIVQSPVPAAVK